MIYLNLRFCSTVHLYNSFNRIPELCCRYQWSKGPCKCDNNCLSETFHIFPRHIHRFLPLSEEFQRRLLFRSILIEPNLLLYIRHKCHPETKGSFLRSESSLTFYLSFLKWSKQLLNSFAIRIQLIKTLFCTTSEILSISGSLVPIIFFTL
jgi:hypothetical protein